MPTSLRHAYGEGAGGAVEQGDAAQTKPGTSRAMATLGRGFSHHPLHRRLLVRKLPLRRLCLSWQQRRRLDRHLVRVQTYEGATLGHDRLLSYAALVPPRGSLTRDGTIASRSFHTVLSPVFDGQFEGRTRDTEPTRRGRHRGSGDGCAVDPDRRSSRCDGAILQRRGDNVSGRAGDALLERVCVDHA
jgi:hypothetical protein